MVRQMSHRDQTAICQGQTPRGRIYGRELNSGCLWPKRPNGMCSYGDVVGRSSLRLILPYQALACRPLERANETGSSEINICVFNVACRA